MSEKRKYDSTVARIAGNIACGAVAKMDAINAARYQIDADLAPTPTELAIANASVRLARAIVAEVERTEPPAVEGKG